MLIIEGPDLVGKTTLAQKFIKTWNENPRKYGAVPVIYNHFSALPERWHHFKSYLPHVTKYVVQDRFHLSEAAYGPVCRGKQLIESRGQSLLEAYLRLVGSVTVQVTATEEILKKLWILL